MCNIFLYSAVLHTFISRSRTLKNVQTMMNLCKGSFKEFLRTQKPHNEYRGVCRTPATIPESRYVMSQIKRYILNRNRIP